MGRKLILTAIDLSVEWIRSSSGGTDGRLSLASSASRLSCIAGELWRVKEGTLILLGCTSCVTEV